MTGGGKIKWMAEGAQNPLLLNAGVLDAALNEFSAHSYRDASLNDVLRAAVWNKGSFYYRFYDKRDLYLSLLHYVGMEKLAFFESRASDAPAAGFFSQYRRMAVLGMEFARHEPRYDSLWRRVLNEDPSVRAMIGETFGELSNNMLSDMINAGIKSGEIRADVAVPVAAMLLTSMMERIGGLITPDATDADLLAAVDSVLDLLQNGLKNNEQ